MLMVQVAVAGLDCNRSEVVQDCLERLVGEWEPNSCLLRLFHLSSLVMSTVIRTIWTQQSEDKASDSHENGDDGEVSFYLASAKGHF